MKYLLMILVLAGCYKVEKERVTGCGVVENTKLVPESHHRSCRITTDMEGHTRTECSADYDPPIYIVYMSWSHGPIESNGSNDKHENMYHRLRQGDYIFITADAVYHVDDDTKNRTFKGHVFIDAKRDKKCVPPLNPEYL